LKTSVRGLTWRFTTPRKPDETECALDEPALRTGHELLKWNDALATGVARIDQQHQMLINLLNDANQCFRKSKDAQAQVKVMEDLIGYTTYHFDSEEELMEAGGYGDRLPDEEKRHVREHRAFAKAVSDYQLALRQGKPIDYEMLFGFLNNWLINHVMNTDQKLGRFLNDSLGLDRTAASAR
jgi:hemerythrin-like metal-binding protein